MDIEHKTNEYMVNYLNEVLEEKIFYLEDTYNRNFGRAIIVMYSKMLTLTDKLLYTLYNLRQLDLSPELYKDVIYVVVNGMEDQMILRELIWHLQEALKFHDADELVCLYDQETGERYDILIVDDTIEGEVQLNVEDINK